MGLAACTLQSCDIATSYYGGKPNVAASASFLAIAILCLVIGVVQTLRSKRFTPYGFAIAIACILEIFGYVARIPGSYNPWDLFPYAQSRLLLTIAPLFITSG
jgi:hypothetical protein